MFDKNQSSIYRIIKLPTNNSSNTYTSTNWSNNETNSLRSTTYYLLPLAVPTETLGDAKPCHADKEQSGLCEVDGYVGSKVIFEDEKVRVWNFTLAPGEMTSMHRHDYDYHFVAVQPSQLEVWGETGERLFDFRAEGTLGFTVEGDFLVPAKGVDLPWPVPRTHAAKNIGPDPYYEILFESKVATGTSNCDSCPGNLPDEL